VWGCHAIKGRESTLGVVLRIKGEVVVPGEIGMNPAHLSTCDASANMEKRTTARKWGITPMHLGGRGRGAVFSGEGGTDSSGSGGMSSSRGPCCCHTACGRNTRTWDITCHSSSCGSSINGSSGACISNLLGESALARLSFNLRLGLC
jgi:hypothetical protein